jgi:hypothetical protein
MRSSATMTTAINHHVRAADSVSQAATAFPSVSRVNGTVVTYIQKLRPLSGESSERGGALAQTGTTTRIS